MMFCLRCNRTDNITTDKISGISLCPECKEYSDMEEDYSATIGLLFSRNMSPGSTAEIPEYVLRQLPEPVDPLFSFGHSVRANHYPLQELGEWEF